VRGKQILNSNRTNNKEIFKNKFLTLSETLNTKKECWSWQSAISLRWKSEAIPLQLAGLERRQGCSNKTSPPKKGKDFFSHVAQRLVYPLVQFLVLYGWGMGRQVFHLIFAAS